MIPDNDADNDADAEVFTFHPMLTLLPDADNRADTLLQLRAEILAHIAANCVRTPLLLFNLWEASYVDRQVLVLPLEVATQIARSHPDGYHSGLWHLAKEYETLMAKALLTNKSTQKPGYQQPKSFSAWPRIHDVQLYREAAALRAALPENFEDVEPEDVEEYCSLISRWHQSTSYISRISGHTRLDRRQLQQLCIALSPRPSHS